MDRAAAAKFILRDGEGRHKVPTPWYGRHACHHKVMVSTLDDTKSRGRPRVDSVAIGVRLPHDQLAPLDAWISDQPEPRPGRPEVMRVALADYLRTKGHLPALENSEGPNQ